MNLKEDIFKFTKKVVYSTIAKLPFVDGNKIAIFCYHSIANDDWRYSVNASEFKKQINRLLKTRRPIEASDLYSYVKNGDEVSGKRFLLCFDDGYKDLLTIKDFLLEKGIHPIVFIIANSKKANRQELDTQRPFLNKREILELKEAGWIMGSHGLTHANFGDLTVKEVTKEIADSKTKLEKELNLKIDYFAYPKGIYNKRILDIVKKSGYKMAFSMDGNIIDRNTNLQRVPRIGVDRFHTFSEFPAIYSSPIIYLRKLIA